MTISDFDKYHWRYFHTLEKDFLETERYITFDLGDNNLYKDEDVTDYGNSKCFSTEFVKQYLSICSEIDVILKSMCKEINSGFTGDKINHYTPVILNWKPMIVEQEVLMKDIKLKPFSNWNAEQSPDWWRPYNKVKHERLSNYKEANLKNVVNALAGLYVLERYFAKYIGDRDNERDIPEDESKIFRLPNYDTRCVTLDGVYAVKCQ